MRFKDAIKVFSDFSRAGSERGSATILGYEMDLKRLCLHLHNPLITQITDGQIIEYINDLVDLGWKKGSMVARVTAYKKFFKYWRKKGYPVVDHELIPNIRREFKMPKVATLEDLKKIMNILLPFSKSSIISRDRAIIQLLADTGVRNGELCGINLDDINDSHSCLIKTEKAQKSIKPIRKVFWSKETHEDLLHWIKIRERLQEKIKFKDPQAVFVGVRNWRAGTRLTISGVSIIMRKISKKAGLAQSMNPHSLRHKFGRDLSKAGANNSIISSLLGHASMNSSYIYTMLEGKDLEETYKKYKGDR